MYDDLGPLIGSQDRRAPGSRDLRLGPATGRPPPTNRSPSFINGTPKHVFTSATPDVEWATRPSSTVRPRTYVAGLKQGEGGDSGSTAASGLAPSLIAAGLVDELRLVVCPGLADGGRRGFSGIAGQQKWELLDARSTSDGQLLLGYRQAS